MIGCGSVAERKSAPAFQQVRGSELIAVSSRRHNSARDYALRHGVPEVFESPIELIRCPHVDAVYIATPPSSHLALAKQVADAGKPCCVEKPMALTHDGAREMLAAFEATGQPLFVSYYRRSLPRFVHVKQWISEGCIGSVRHAHWSFARRPDPSEIIGDLGWRVDPEEASGGHFEDLACHGLDLLDFLIGPIAEACGNSANQQRLYAVPDSVCGVWRHETGATGSGFWNFGSSNPVDAVEIRGSEGFLRFSIFDEAPIALETTEGSQTIDIPNPDPIQLYHVQGMIEHLRGIRRHSSTGESAARTAWVIDQMLGRKSLM